jgi:hypothetical protein
MVCVRKKRVSPATTSIAFLRCCYLHCVMLLLLLDCLHCLVAMIQLLLLAVLLLALLVLLVALLLQLLICIDALLSFSLIGDFL